MALQPFQDEQLNYFKFASIVLNEFPNALRYTFRSMWDNTFGHLPGFQPWDDSTAVRNLFLGSEGGTTKVPTNLSYEEWDCTALFQATIYARSFALPDSKGHHRTLSDLYVKPHKLPHGNFHASVISLSGNKAETFALAIDQLRRLRNSLCHSTSSEIDKSTFDLNMQYAKDAFKALGVKADPINVIGGLTESDFPTNEVRKLEQATKKEAQAYIAFLEGMSSDIDELRALSTAIEGKVESTARKEDIATLEKKINDLTMKLSPTRDEPGNNSIYLCRITVYSQYSANGHPRKWTALHLRTLFSIALFTSSQTLHLHIAVSRQSLVSGRGHF